MSRLTCEFLDATFERQLDESWSDNGNVVRLCRSDIWISAVMDSMAMGSV